MDLYAATPNNIPVESFEAYGVALALVAQAFVDKKPHLIQGADNLFQQLQQLSVSTLEGPASIYAAKVNREVDFALERGLCSLLVGQLDECHIWLGLDSDGSPYRNPSIVEFVLENSKNDDDNDLPGLCKLLETWLLEVVFPRFRDTNGIQFRLGDYYDDPTVLRYLERLERNGSSPLAAAAAIVKIGAAEATAVLDHVKTSALQALQKVFPLGQRDRSVRRHEDSETSESFYVIESEAPVEKDDQVGTATVNEVPGQSGSEEIREEELITDRIKDVGLKIMGSGVVIGLALIGFKYMSSRNSPSTLHKELGATTASNVATSGR